MLIHIDISTLFRIDFTIHIYAKSLTMGYKGWTIKTFLLLHLLIFSVDPTKEEVDNNLIIKTIQVYIAF